MGSDLKGVIGCGRCPLGLKRLPGEPCPEGLKAIKAARQGREGGCPWFVNDAGANFCFFTWLAQNGGEPIPDTKISNLLLIPDTQVKKDIVNFRKRSQELKQILED